jgi:hypothetical protein
MIVDFLNSGITTMKQWAEISVLMEYNSGARNLNPEAGRAWLLEVVENSLPCLLQIP